MRHDDPSITSSQSTISDLSPRFRAPVWVGTLALVALMILTSLAVASALSAWLVPPYLILMCLVLFPTGGRDLAADPEVTEPGPGSIAESVANGAEVETRPQAAEDDRPAVESPDDQARTPEPVAVKTRRGKKRKARGEAVEPAGVTWVRVGPGKFVRAESPDPAVEDVPSKTEAEPLAPLGPPQAATEEPPPEFAPNEPEPACEEAPPPDTSESDAPAVDGQPEPGADLPEPAEVAHAAEAFVATSGQPECCDETNWEERVPEDELSPAPEEATPEAAPEPDDSTQVDYPEVLEMHHDTPCDRAAGIDVWSDIRSRDETTFEDLGPETDEPRNLLDVPTADASEPGPADPSGDNGIAPDAPELDREPTLQDVPPEADEPGRPAPASSINLSPRSTSGVAFVSPRTIWRSVVTATSRVSGATSPGRIARSGRTDPVSSGFRAHSRRGAGRVRQIIRAFPPRSPPLRGSARCARGSGEENRAANAVGDPGPPF